MYIEDIADQSMVDEVKHRIEQVKVDGLTMTDKELEEFITGQVYNPYPLVRYTERPDVVAAHLYQGMIAIIVDTVTKCYDWTRDFVRSLNKCGGVSSNSCCGNLLTPYSLCWDYCISLPNANMAIIRASSRIFT